MEYQEFVPRLEELLNQLVSGDTDTARIRTATSTLNNNFYSSVNCVAALVQILSSSTHWQVRQLAAVELRKRSTKWWSKIDLNTQAAIKNQLLEVILREPHELVRHATARVISSVAKIEIPAGAWNDLLQFLYQCCQSPDAGHREVGIFVLYTLFEVIIEAFQDNLRQLFELFGAALNDPESKVVRVTTLQALGKVAEIIEADNKEEIQLFRDLIPSMVNVIQQCLEAGDSDSAIKGFELFDGLLLLEIPLLSNHLQQLIEFVLIVSRNNKYDDSVRVMSLQFLIWVINYKKSKVQRLKLVGPIIQQLMPIGVEDDPDDQDDESPSRMAFRVINTLSTKLPPQQVFPVVMENVVTYVQNHDPKFRKAGMMAFAVLIEGCSDYMRPKFNELLPLVCNGLRDPETIVRRGACIALGCLAEELDQEIAANHATLLPLLFDLMNDPNTEIPKQACNALDAILEGLDNEILLYLPTLMERLLLLLDNGPNEVKATVTAAIGSAAHAAGSEFSKYFPVVISRLLMLMTLNKNNEDVLLRGIATDTVGSVAEAVGKELIQPHVNDIMRLAIEGTSLDNARLRECSYCLFAVMARVFKEEFSVYLGTIMPQLLKSCQMEEFDPFTLDEFTINSAIVDEKEIAADVIGEIFANTRSNFLSYVEASISELVKLSNHHSEGVRKSVISSLVSFLITFYSMSNPTQWEAGLPVKVPVHENVQSMITTTMPVILSIMGDEESKIVMVQLCQEFIEALKHCGPAIVADYIDQIAQNILNIYEKKSASDLVSALALVLGPGFASYFKVYLPHITKYYKKSKPTSDRSMAIGCLGESTVGLKSGISEFTEQLLSLYLKALGDEEEEVRSNSAFAIGVLCEYTTIDISSQYNVILSRLHPLFNGKSELNVTDNACGAVCRMIIKCPQAIPIDQVLDVIMDTLPLKQDYEENEPVFKCIFYLFRANNSFVLNHIPDFLKIFAQVLSPPEDQLKDHTRQELIDLIKALNQQFPDVVARSPLGPFLQA
ncbi:984_t:CDS:10 [Funneliformis caledonium]|uniref:984_t:CDS:1 n=1 Tax=Funneliformis caledonium TaxID=1117310 RepID=A0A9N8V539_9GLOM|nr:984_t:CDS:10 [Funneliformis caledonium]